MAQFCDAEPTAEEVNALSVHELKLVIPYLGGNFDVGATKAELVTVAMSLLYGEEVEAAGTSPAPRANPDAAVNIAPASLSVADLQLKLQIAKVQLAQAQEQTIKAL